MHEKAKPEASGTRKKPALPKKALASLALALALGGCGVTPEPDRSASVHRYDWSREGIRASLEYRTVQTPPSGSACAGMLSIENYGKRSYSVLLFSVNVFSAAGEVVATDRFSLSSSLNPGGRAELPFDPRNPLNPVVVTRSYSECPRDMAAVDVKLEAF